MHSIGGSTTSDPCAQKEVIALKFCTNCGKQLDDHIRFCPICGTALDSTIPDSRAQDILQEEKKCLDQFYRFFKYERLSWKISGIVMLVFSLFIFILSGLVSVIPAISGVEDSLDLVGVIFLFLWISLYGLLFLPIAIINLKMVKRCDNYMNTLYSDAAPMVKRCNSVGMIVLGAIFNTVAMAFIIVNFVRAKNNAAQLQQIIARQKAYRSGNSN